MHESLLSLLACGGGLLFRSDCLRILALRVSSQDRLRDE